MEVSSGWHWRLVRQCLLRPREKRTLADKPPVPPTTWIGCSITSSLSSRGLRNRRVELARLQEGEQVGDFGQRQLVEQAGRHHRDLRGILLLDTVFGDFQLG